MVMFDLLVLALPVACIAWTVTNEEVAREVREWCVRHAKDTRHPLVVRKLCYLMTCQYCFSHWVALGVLAITDYHLLYTDWRGSFVAFFVTVWAANIYMSLYERLRVGIRRARAEATTLEWKKVA